MQYLPTTSSQMSVRVLAAIAACFLGIAVCAQVNADLAGLGEELPDDAVLFEAEDMDVSGEWWTGATRAGDAPWGLSGGAVLNSNRSDAIARKTIELPAGEWSVWARVFDWAGAPGHYELTLCINGRAGQIGITEPMAPAYIWERWGSVEGGAVDIEVSNPDSFNACLDCLLFVADPDFVLPVGPAVGLGKVSVEGALPDGPAVISLSVRPLASSPAPDKVFVAATRANAHAARRDTIWSEAVPMDVDEKSWQAGQLIELPEIEVPALRHLWPGEYAVSIGIPNTSLAVGKGIASFTKGETDMPEAVSAQVRSHRGSPTVFIDGEPQFAFAYLNHAGDRARYYSQMEDIGVRFFTVGAGHGATPDGFDPTNCDRPLLQILRHQPRALIFPRVGVTAPEWWLKEHPEERVKFDDGTVGPQSMFSEAWLNDACTWIEDYARYIRNSPYADHVIGIHICSGVSAEWQSWGLWSNQRGDFSAPAMRAWREYLREKYGTDDVLSKAWGRNTTIGAAEMPSRERREADTGFFRMPGEHQDIIDFYGFYWRGTARAIESLAAAAKRGGGRDWLVGFFYGYEIQYGGNMQESQHLGMRRVMNCPDIDFFCSPAMYSVRQPGGTSTFMSFTDSLKLRDKIWFDEADNRTHLTDNAVAPAEDMFETLNVLEREFAHVVTEQAGIWWFDMGGGWYDDPKILTLMQEMREFGETNDSEWQPEAEIAVFIDDKSSYRLRPDAGFLSNGITQLMARMPRVGAPYDTYLLEDIARGGEYKMLIFPLALDLSDDERAAIEQLKADGRTLVFVGKAGIGRWDEGRVTHDPQLSAQLLGIEPEGNDWQLVDQGDWRLAWKLEPRPTIAKLRAIARQAGVHIYHSEDDAFYAGNGMIALHAQNGGTKTVHLPRALQVRELFAEEPLSATTDRLEFDLRAKETRCFAVDVPGAR